MSNSIETLPSLCDKNLLYHAMLRRVIQQVVSHTITNSIVTSRDLRGLVEGISPLVLSILPLPRSSSTHIDSYAIGITHARQQEGQLRQDAKQMQQIRIY